MEFKAGQWNVGGYIYTCGGLNVLWVFCTEKTLHCGGDADMTS